MGDLLQEEWTDMEIKLMGKVFSPLSICLAFFLHYLCFNSLYLKVDMIILEFPCNFILLIVIIQILRKNHEKLRVSEKFLIYGVITHSFILLMKSHFKPWINILTCKELSKPNNLDSFSQLSLSNFIFGNKLRWTLLNSDCQSRNLL